jgi:hypothetical protein
MSNVIALQTTTFEDEDIIFVTYKGKRLYPVPQVGEMHGYSRKDSLRAFQRNKKFIQGYYYSVKLTHYERAVSIPCLTGEGVLIFTARLGIERLSEDRQDKIIRTVQFMAKSAMDVIEGRVVPAIDIKSWREERVGNRENHKLTMSYVKRYEVPKIKPGENPFDLFPKESRAINEDAIGVHINGASDKLNAIGLHMKNDAHVQDRALMRVGIDFETRHAVIKDMLDEQYPGRIEMDIFLTTEERARISRKCPESQKGISDFVAVV